MTTTHNTTGTTLLPLPCSICRTSTLLRDPDGTPTCGWCRRA